MTINYWSPDPGETVRVRWYAETGGERTCVRDITGTIAGKRFEHEPEVRTVYVLIGGAEFDLLPRGGPTIVYAEPELLRGAS
jgi:hypothetical protein